MSKIDGVLSSSASVTCGVPQGSIMGPLLFSIYINSLPFALKGLKVNLYADDMAITVTAADATELESELSDTIAIIDNWFKDTCGYSLPTLRM